MQKKEQSQLSRAISLVLVAVMVFALFPIMPLGVKAETFTPATHTINFQDNYQDLSWATWHAPFLKNNQETIGVVSQYNYWSWTGTTPILETIGEKQAVVLKGSASDSTYASAQISIFNEASNELWSQNSGLVNLTVTYWDGKASPENVSGFELHYDPWGDALSACGGTVLLTGTETWKTHTFHLSDAQMQNMCTYHDWGWNFQLDVNLCGTGYSDDPVYIQQIDLEILKNPGDGSSASVQLNSTSNGIGPDTFVRQYQGGTPSVVTHGESEEAWSLVSGDPVNGNHLDVSVGSHYMNNNTGLVDIDVTYWDGTDGTFELTYDSSDDAAKSAGSVTLTGLNKWVTKTFHLTDAVLKDYQDVHQGVAFRLSTISGTVDISKIQVTRGSEPDVDYALAVFDAFDLRYHMTVFECGIAAHKGSYTDKNGITKSYWMLGDANCEKTVEGEDPIYLGVDIANDYIGSSRTSATISIEYLDKGTGCFEVMYAPDYAKTAAVRLTDTNEWKTFSFDVEDYVFSDFNVHVKSGDFRIGLWSSEFGELSASPVAIASIKVQKYDFPDVSLEVVSESNQTGFIYTDNQAYDLGFDLKQTDSSKTESENVAISYDILDYQGKCLKSVDSEIISVPVEGVFHKLDLSSVNAYGTYTITVRLVDSENRVLKRTYDFSRVRSAGSVNDQFGVGNHLQRWGRADAEPNLEIASIGGLGWTRDDFDRTLYEYEKGKYAVPSRWTENLENAKKNNLKVLAILEDWYGTYETFGSDEWLQGYADYAYHVVLELQDDVAAWEILNEMNLDYHVQEGWTAEKYAKVVATVSEAIRLADPDAVIVAGVTSNAPVDWLSDLLDYDGVYDLIDVISVHPYKYPNSPESGKLETAITSLEQIWGDREPKKIWITEIGWPTHKGQFGVSEEMSGAYLVRTFTWAMANPDLVERVFWYNMQNDGEDITYNEDNFGLIKCWVNENVPYAAKDNYAAMSAMFSQLTGATYVGEFDLGDGVIAYHFTRDGKDIVVAWCNDVTRNLLLNLGDQDLVIMDLFGNEKPLFKTDGIAPLNLNDVPVYLIGDLSDGLDVSQGGYEVEKRQYYVTADSIVPVVINRDCGFEKLSGEYKLELPSGWTASNTTFAPVTDSDSTQDIIYITVPAGTANGANTVNITAVSDGNTLSKLTTNVTVSDLCLINPTVIETENGMDFMVKVDLNNTNGTSSKVGTITMTAPSEWVDLNQPQSFNVPVGSDATFLFNVPDNLGHEMFLVEFDLEMDNGDKMTITKYVSFLYAIETSEQVKIDGIIDAQWDDAMEFNVGEEDWGTILSTPWTGITAKGYTMWDSQNLYLAVKVQDKSHSNGKLYGDIWNGDSVQIALDPGRQVKPALFAFNEIGFALNSETGEIYTWKWSSATESTEVTDLDVSIVRDEAAATTTYEIAIPWADIIRPGTIENPENIGMTVVINNADRDDNGNVADRNGWLEFMDGVADGSKSADLFGDLVLVNSKHKHNAADTWVFDSENHWHECSCGEKLDVSSHEFVLTGKINASDKDGYTGDQVCKVCGYTIAGEIIPADKETDSDGGTGKDDLPDDKETGKDEIPPVVDRPETGDSMNLSLLVCLLVLSALGIGTIVFLNRKKKFV